MSLPNVVAYGPLTAANATSIVATQNATSSLPLATTVVGVFQQRIQLVSGGNDSGIFFRIIGLNQANHTVTEFLPGGNGATATSNLDYISIVSITPVSAVNGVPTATASTISAGPAGQGSCLWQIMNWHVSPTNIMTTAALSTSAVTGTIQYTVDDPNNLPLLPGLGYPVPFNAAAIATSAFTSFINWPVTGIRLFLGTSNVSAVLTVIQAGIGSP